MAKKYKAIVRKHFKINEKGVLTEYNKGETYVTYNKKRIDNLRINKLLE